MVGGIKMSENKVTNSMTTNVEGGVLVIERIFNAPRDLVFKAFSEPERLASWCEQKGGKQKITNLNLSLTSYGIMHALHR
jgi:hypothetical protein